MNFSNPDFVARKVLKPNDEPFVPTMRPPAEQLHKADEPRNTVPMASPKSAPAAEPEKSAPAVSEPKPAAAATKQKTKEKVSREAMSEDLLKLVGLYPGRTSQELIKLLESGSYDIRPGTTGRSIGQFCKWLAKQGRLRSKVGARNRLCWYPIEEAPKAEPKEKSKALAKAPPETVEPKETPPAQWIDISEQCSYCVGSAIEHLVASHDKRGRDALADLHQAHFFIEREIARLNR